VVTTWETLEVAFGCGLVQSCLESTRHWRKVWAVTAGLSDLAPATHQPEASPLTEAETRLLQLGVFGFGLLQDGDVGVGVFPEGQEVLVGITCLFCVARQGISSA